MFAFGGICCFKEVRLLLINRLIVGLCLILAVGPAGAPVAVDPLRSWNDTRAKRTTVAFVAQVTQPGPDFVPVPERIAVFDNDGTLWPENPMPFQAAFAVDEVKRRLPQEPALASKPMIKALLADDISNRGCEG